MRKYKETWGNILVIVIRYVLDNRISYWDEDDYWNLWVGYKKIIINFNVSGIKTLCKGKNDNGI